MPYKNIVFVKLEKRLLNDPRWWSMSEPAQLIYVKLILLAADTYNKIPKNDIVLRKALRSRLNLKSFQKCLKEIKNNFPKFKDNKHYCYFEEFETKTNYIPKREIPRKSLGFPKGGADKDKEEEEDKDKEKNQPYWTVFSEKNTGLLKTVYKKGFNIYALLNRFKKECGFDLPEKVVAKVCEYFVNNQEKVRDNWAWFIVSVKKASEEYFAEQNIREGQEWKNQSAAQSIKTIIAGMGKEARNA
ncbi:MAG: hypothetical protein DRP74_02175 [Candidatus Omnitrophota bacterium]|nr:MAG: hypothetical protein DRP74_02175 [Candidatus Omnitrophota bacterium]